MISATLRARLASACRDCGNVGLRLRSRDVRDLSLPPNLSFAILRVDDHHRCLHCGCGEKLAASELGRYSRWEDDTRGRMRLVAPCPEREF